MTETRPMSEVDKSMTRARKWAQMFYGKDDIHHEIGENFEYYLDHVDEFESGSFTFTDLPRLSDIHQWLMHISVMFGARWAVSTATIWAVTDTERRLVGLYAHEENAVQGASADPSLSVEGLGVAELTVEDQLQSIEGATTEVMQKTGENIRVFVEHHEEFEDGSFDIGTLPNFGETAKALIVYSVLFGRVWEFSHPSLYCVLRGDDQLVELYGSIDNAEANVRPEADERVQRVTVQDGDLPPEAVIKDI